jgi:hypothetical protein
VITCAKMASTRRERGGSVTVVIIAGQVRTHAW